MSVQNSPNANSWQRLGSGIHSVVWRARKGTDSTRGSGGDTTDVESSPVDDLPNWVAVKVVYDNRSMPPHDILREAAILQTISHPNIVSFLGFIQGGSDVPYALYLPLIPLSLTIILSSPLFSPVPLTGPYSAFCRPVLATPERPEGSNPFSMVARSLIYQLLLAISYIHSLDPPIAHRDINPGNILIDPDGTVKLVDFGIAWSPHRFKTASGAIQVHESSHGHPFDDWTETPEKMCCQVATGPHRPPELLFSPTSYSATAVDIWSLGTTIAQFFTPLRLIPSQSPSPSPCSTASDEADESFPDPFLISPSLRNKIDYRATWERTTLFKGEQGELGLAWSIFRLRGTPNHKTWPLFNSLPDVSKIEFHQANAKPLHTVLPHLPSPSPTGLSDGSMHLLEDESPVYLIDSFLAYPPLSRLPVAQAVHHPWFSTDLILPVSHPEARDGKWKARWEGRTLGEWLAPVMKREAGKLTRHETQDF